MKEYQKRLLVIAKNNAEQRMHTATAKVRYICNNLKSKTNNKCFINQTSHGEITREKDLITKKRMKQAVIYLAKERFTDDET